MRTVSKRIMVVEEIVEFIERERTLLNRSDFDIITVRSGDEALFRARNEIPDLMILNFYMPDLNGYNVCRELKGDSMTSHIPVLIIATLGEEDEDPCHITQSAGCDGCVIKPIQHDDLVPAVEKNLGVPPRKHPRIPVTLPCIISDEDGQRECFIGNLTPQGAFLQAEPPPWAGDIVKVQIPGVTGSEPLEVQMAIRWSRDAEGGLPGRGGGEFLSPPSEFLQLVDELLAAHSGDEEDGD